MLVRRKTNWASLPRYPQRGGSFTFNELSQLVAHAVGEQAVLSVYPTQSDLSYQLHAAHNGRSSRSISIAIAVRTSSFPACSLALAGSRRRKVPLACCSCCPLARSLARATPLFHPHS